MDIYFVVKFVMFVWKDENKRKQAWDGPLFLKKEESDKMFLKNWPKSNHGKPIYESLVFHISIRSQPIYLGYFCKK